MNRWLAELLGTFFLVFAGCGAIVANQVSGGAVTHPGIALTFGLVVMALAYTLGDVSGCHINPAVTIGLWAAGRFPARHVAGYLTAQLVGAFVAAVLLRWMFPEATTLGETLPVGAWSRSFILEVILTWMLMLAVLRTTVGASEKTALAALAIGGVVGLEAMFAGPICGASMNPARSLGPAFISGHTDYWWLYVAAPILGALLAVLTNSILNMQTSEPAPQ